MNRRQLLTGGLSAAFLLACKRITPEGEEWRVDKLGQKNKELRPIDEAMQEARTRIEKFRKPTLNLTIKVRGGGPLINQEVELVQTNSEFDWGHAFGFAASQVANNKAFQEKAKKFTEVFNSGTLKCYWNEHWHYPIEKKRGQRQYARFLDELAWMQANNIRPKGHPLVWTVPKALPDWFLPLPYQEQMNLLVTNAAELVQLGGESVMRWDLANEVLWEPALKNVAKRKWPHFESTDNLVEYIAPVLEAVRKVNANAIYSLNDYGLENDFHKDITARQLRERMIALVNALRDIGLAPDAIGTQAHIGKWFHPDEFYGAIDHLSQTGVAIQITEFWAHDKRKPIVEKDERVFAESMADYFENMMLTAFSHKSVNHFTIWQGDIFNDNITSKPTYERIKKVITQDLRTNRLVSTDSKGTVSLPAFEGSYLVKKDGKVIGNFNHSGRELFQTCFID